ncbi:type 1 glutamine amidotransferase domain-containing protein [Desulfovibrio inopinatus]|uniref:type 1 glutamine amidotransferase domain-containing protein n=1 Tax=Desulfovibrio inopinatus TaxID=102109 RepID=UPI0003FD2705|nr:type 1 glutamine amidotransferase domain-containing protein [Desulfovibrio inopinatus]
MNNKALIVSADGFEDSELLYPYYRLREAGFEVDIAAPAKGSITGKKGYEVQANLALSDVDTAGSCGYKALVLPGGKAPAALREMKEAIDIVTDFASSGIPIAAICHGPQLLVSARLLAGKKATCYASVAEELKGAGALYEDSEVVVDHTLITSRKPDDLPAFSRELMKQIL